MVHEGLSAAILVCPTYVSPFHLSILFLSLLATSRQSSSKQCAKNIAINLPITMHNNPLSPSLLPLKLADRGSCLLLLLLVPVEWHLFIWQQLCGLRNRMSVPIEDDVWGQLEICWQEAVSSWRLSVGMATLCCLSLYFFCLCCSLFIFFDLGAL